MLIGARIISNNLSGKTATVQFTPLTGTTSGTTVDIGSVTIPFNNITSHPYGNYSINVTDYDYVYTLTIPEPAVGDVQMFVYMDTMLESSNYGVATLNFNDFTAEIIDLGVDITVWGNRDIYELTNSGFMYYFRGEDNSDDRLVIFTDSTNTEIGRYSGTTDNVSRSTLDGKWIAFEDGDNGVLTYSNGKDVFTYTWDNATHYVDIENDYDSVTSDGTFIIKKNERGNWNYNGSGQSFLVNPTDGTTSLFKSWTDGTNINHKMSPSSDFIVVETQNQDDTTGNTYTNLQIYDTSGTLLETVSLTGATYDYDYSDFHGTNKFTTVYYNYDDVDVDYKIISYNSNTLTLIQTSHVRTSSYSNINMNSQNNFYPADDGQNKGGIVLSFYNITNYENIGYTTSFFDFVYMFNNQTSFSTYSFANDENRRIADYGPLSDTYRNLCDDESGNLALLTIMSGSTYIQNFNIALNDINNININGIGNRTIVQVFTNGYSTVYYYLINAVGVQIDDMEFAISSSSLFTRGENAYLNIESEGNIGYYVYSGSTTFTQTDYYDTNETSNSYAIDKLKSNMVLFTNNQAGFRILNATGITQEFQFPQYTNLDIRVGESKFMLVYADSNGDGIVKVRLYDFNGTLLNSGTTSMINSWDTSHGVRDRFLVYGSVNGNTEITLVSATNITSLTLDNNSSEYRINDYIWEND
jgi:hypothetical protein